jgi:hypothetical protein
VATERYKQDVIDKTLAKTVMERGYRGVRVLATSTTPSTAAKESGETTYEVQ